MEKKLTPEILEKAKTAKSPEELIALAKEKGIELSTEQANAYFAKLNPEDGGLTDDELDNVAGGCFGEDYDNRIKVSPTDRPCIYYACEICEQGYSCIHRRVSEWTCGNCLHIRRDADGVTHCNSVNVAQTGKLY
jgi:predicted ribosomally synthesized peptide with nif11-like leader